MNIGALFIQIVIGLIVSAPALWYAGKWRVGAAKAKFSDAVTISVLGAITNAVIESLLGGGIGSLLQFIVNLYLINKYFETDWVNSFIISFVAALLVFVVFTGLAILGIFAIS